MYVVECITAYPKDTFKLMFKVHWIYYSNPGVRQERCYCTILQSPGSHSVFFNLFYMFNANVFKILLLYNIFAWQPSMVKPVTVLATLRQQQLVGDEQVVYSGTL